MSVEWFSSKALPLIVAVFVCVFSFSVWAADEKATELEKTTVFGDREMPKVLYIVPWKRAELGDLVERPVKSLLDESLKPLDRDEFTRRIGYYKELHYQEVAGGDDHGHEH